MFGSFQFTPLRKLLFYHENAEIKFTRKNRGCYVEKGECFIEILGGQKVFCSMWLDRIIMATFQSRIIKAKVFLSD